MKRVLDWCVAICAAAVFAVIYAGALATWGNFPYRLFDGDFVHPHLLVRDFALGGSIFEWRSSAALYAFPDWLFALTALTSLESRAATVVSSVLFLGAVIFAGANVLRTYRPDWPLTALTAIFGASLVALTGLATRAIQWLLDYAASLYIHTGASLVVLVSIPLAARLLSGSASWTSTLVLAGLGAATIYSDPIFLPWFSLPFIAATLLLAFTRRTPRILIQGGIAFAVHLSAFVLERGKPFPGATASLISGDPWTSFKGMMHFIYEGLELFDLAVVLYCLAVVLAGGLLFATLKKLRTGESSPIMAQDLLLSLVVLSVAILPIVTGAIDHASKMRYVIAIVYLAPIMLLRFALTAVKKQAWIVLAAGATIACASGLVAFAPTLLRSMVWGQHSELIACLDEHGLTDGLADYDFAKSVIFLTNGRIHLGQIGYSAKTNYSSRWQTERMDGSAFTPTFVLAQRLAEDHLRPYGEPSRIISCPTSDVRIYDTPLPVAAD